MNLISLLILLIADFYLILLGLCLVVETRLFHFSSLLSRLRQLVTPLLRPLRLALGGERASILAAMALVVVLKGLLLGFLDPGMLLFSPASYLGMQGAFQAFPWVTSVVLSLAYVLDYALVIFLICLVVTALVEPYTVNPITRTAYRFVELGEELGGALLRRLAAGWQRRLAVGASAVLLDALLAAGLVLFLSVLSATGPTAGRTLALGLYSALSLCIYGAGFFTLLLIVGAVMTWFSPDPRNPLVQFISAVTYPILLPFRRAIPLLGGIDISPIFAILLLEATRSVASRLLAGTFGVLI